MNRMPRLGKQNKGCGASKRFFLVTGCGVRLENLLTMTMFLLSVALFLMFLPALLSVVFARRSLKLVVWNMLWYFLMGSIGAQLFGPWGWMAGGLFAFLFVVRLMNVGADSGQRIQVRRMAVRQRVKFPSSAQAQGANDIEAEFKVETRSGKSQAEGRLGEETT